MWKFAGALIISVITMSALAGMNNAQAENKYPTKPIRLIVPYAPGGGSDAILRPIAMAMERTLGQKIAIVNINGAEGAVGWAQAAKAAPDGYTITILTNAMIVRETMKLANVGVHDFAPIANIGFVDLTLSSRGDGPYQNLKTYADTVKKSPNTVSVAIGIGTPSETTAILLNHALGSGLRAVNVGGGAQKKTAVLGGHVDSLIEPISSVIASHQAKQLTVLAVLSDKRLTFAPDIPTAKEQGYNVTARLFYGLGAPKGTPKEIVEALAAAVEGLSKDAQLQDEMKKISVSWEYYGPHDFADVIDKEFRKTAALVQQNIK